MTRLAAYSICQPAVVVADVDEAIDRVHALFGAVPSERVMGASEAADESAAGNAVYAFEDTTFLELLGRTRSPERQHRRARDHQRADGSRSAATKWQLQINAATGALDTRRRTGQPGKQTE